MKLTNEKILGLYQGLDALGKHKLSMPLTFAVARLRATLAPIVGAWQEANTALFTRVFGGEQAVKNDDSRLPAFKEESKLLLAQETEIQDSVLQIPLSAENVLECVPGLAPVIESLLWLGESKPCLTTT